MNDERVGGRHQLNIGHLVMGLAFLGIVGVAALVWTDTVSGDEVRWLLPVPWVVAGAVGLAASAVTGTRRHAVRRVGWVGGEPAPGATHEPRETPDQSTDAVTEPAPLSIQPDESRQSPEEEKEQP